MEKNKITQDKRDELRADFPDEAYKAHPTKTFLTTLKAMYIVERLNDVFGIGRWNVTHEVVIATDNYVLMKGRLVILDFRCEIPEQFGGHQTSGKNVELADGYKSAITDILSKSASYLEIGIDMFKGNINPKNPTTKTDTNKDIIAIKKELNQSEVAKWNGKIYPDNIVYIDSIKRQIPVEQIEKLKKLDTYKPYTK